MTKTSGTPVIVGDSGYWTFAAKIRLQSLTAAGLIRVANGGTLQFYLVTDGSGGLSLQFRNSGSTIGRAATTIASGMSTGTWYTIHIAGSKDGSGAIKCYLNGTETSQSLAGLVWSLGVGDMDWSAATQAVMAATNTGGSSKLNADVAFVWFDGGTSSAKYVTDTSKFYNGASDVNLGTNGTGSGLAQPRIFYGGPQTVAGWNAGTNHGVGGNFTMNGAVS